MKVIYLECELEMNYVNILEVSMKNTITCFLKTRFFFIIISYLRCETGIENKPDVTE